MITYVCYTVFFAFLIYSLKKNCDETQVFLQQFLKGIIPSHNFIELADHLISVVNDGKLYRWFLYAYSSNNKNSFLEKEILKLFYEYKKNDTIRFGKFDILHSDKIRYSLGITKTPYIFIVQNKSIYEFDSIPNYDNLKKFINTNFNNSNYKSKIYPSELNIPILNNTVPDLSSFFNFASRILSKIGLSYSTIKIICYISILVCSVIFRNALISIVKNFGKKNDNKNEQPNNIERRNELQNPNPPNENRNNRPQEAERQEEAEEEDLVENDLENEEEMETDDEDIDNKPLYR